MLPNALQNLINEFAQLPGVGPRTAERFAFYILRMPRSQSQALAQALSKLHQDIRSCSICHNLSEGKICNICGNPRRDSKLIAVVEEPLDVVALEKTGLFKGLYHVLGGVISPIDGIGPEQLNITSLLKRLKGKKVAELIIATNPTTEGEATAMYLQKRLPKGIKITRLARGLPIGSDLEYADQITLGRALEGRQSL
ncbi:recombination protein RecR [Candidatus Microgenomates bacterium]|nr:recombination protein RecR [Candidatus Microgenomates bacterium]